MRGKIHKKGGNECVKGDMNGQWNQFFRRPGKTRVCF